MRLTSEQRRETIIQAARRVFSEKGFYGATTRALAVEAGVSEALLFKHFPNKEAMYEAMLESCRKTEVGGEYHRLLALQPSTSTLIVMLHFLCSKMIHGEKETAQIHRFVLRSLCEDGAFAGTLFKNFGATFVSKIRECLEAADRAGELRKSPAPSLKNAAWLTQHLVLMLGFLQVPGRPLVDYKSSRERLVEESVIFALRGLGMSDESIAKYYNPRALELLAKV